MNKVGCGWIFILIPGLAVFLIVTAVFKNPLMGFCSAVGLVWLLLIGNRSLGVQEKVARKKGAKYSFIADETIFNNSILVLLTAVMQADGKKSRAELKYVEVALREHYSEKRVAKMIEMINKIYPEKLNFYGVCNIVEMNFRLNERVQLMHFLVGIVTADGLLTKAELERLHDIAKNIGIPARLVHSVLRMFTFITEEEVENRKKRNEQKVTITTMQLAQAFDILGVSEDASVKTIKKAYRKLAMKHHPDRLIHLGQEHQKSAKEKFQSISDAYEYIKSKKGFS